VVEPPVEVPVPVPLPPPVAVLVAGLCTTSQQPSTHAEAPGPQSLTFTQL